MKRFRSVIVAFCLFFCVTFFAGCYMTNAQPMKKIKGTYRLTTYQTTDKRYGAEDSIETTIINQIEENGVEVYLVVTGSNTGYYAYKDKNQEAYIQEVELTYEASAEDTSKYAFVGYRCNTYSDFEKFGVTKNCMNKTVPAICSKLFNQPVYQRGYTKNWKKQSGKTDLSYVKGKFGNCKQYAFGESVS